MSTLASLALGARRRELKDVAATRHLRMGFVSRAAPARAFDGPRGPRLSLIMVLFRVNTREIS